VTAMLSWGILLLAAAMVLLVFEFVAPSGLIALVSAMLVIAGVVCLFRDSVSSGLTGILGVLVLVPMILILGFKIIPATRAGQQMLFGESGKHEPVIPESAGHELEALLGAEGEAVTDLRPVGSARIDDCRIDVRSEIAFIPKGTRIRVTGVEGSQVKVRPVV
jgi:membrane-bound serine protease (ClpP class)